MIRVGIIGYGKMGILHGGLINATNKAKVTAICDKSWVMRFGIKKVYPEARTFSNVEDMLNKTKLDAVIITTPTFHHAKAALLCMKRHCNLFIEKPLASFYEDSRRLYKVAKREGIKIQVGFCNRFNPAISKGKYLLDQGVIGIPKEAKAFMYIADVLEEQSGWRYSKSASGGGVLMDFGIHMLDQLCWYFGRIQSVKADAEKLYSREVEDELRADLVFAKGVHVVFHTSWSKEQYRKSYARLEIQGTDGSMAVTDQTLDIYDREGNRVRQYVYPDLYSGAYIDIGGLWFSKQMEAFLEVIEGKREPNLKSALYVQKAVKEIYKSVELHERVNIDCNI